jgi:hypothetical protein
MARRGLSLQQTERILILTKTYPSPSRDYVETTCVAAVHENGELRRVFPVPFRLLEGEKRFKKWQWITARFRTPSDDRRPESRRIDADSIELGEQILTPKANWSERMRWIEPHILPSFQALENRRQATDASLGFLRPTRLVGLDIVKLPPSERDWNEEQIAKLTQDSGMASLFTNDGPPVPKPRTLRKLPYRFYYRYEIETPQGTEESRHSLIDWEVGALYWNCQQSHGEDWETPFRAKLEAEFAEKDLVLMLGNEKRFHDQWHIIGLVFPPKPAAPTTQQALAL